MQRASADLPEKRLEPVSPETTASTRVPSPGLEHVRSDEETLKEVASTNLVSPGKEYTEESPKSKQDHLAQDAQERRKRRKWPWIVGAVLVIMLLGIALGVGLGVGLKNNSG